MRPDSAIWPHAASESRSRSVTGAGLLLARRYPPIYTFRPVAGAIEAGAERLDLWAAGQHRQQAGRADGDCSVPGSAATRAGPGRKRGTVPSHGHQGRTARRPRTGERLPSGAAGQAAQPRRRGDRRYRDGEIDACTVDETIHHYHLAATQLWKFCFAGGGGTHAELIAGILDRMTADAETIDWWERATPRRHQ
jgi:hypothetical protein